MDRQLDFHYGLKVSPETVPIWPSGRAAPTAINYGPVFVDVWAVIGVKSRVHLSVRIWHGSRNQKHICAP